jgi:hypothetical protein
MQLAFGRGIDCGEGLIDASRECFTMLSIEKRTRKKLIEILIDILRSSIAEDYEDEHVCNPSGSNGPSPDDGRTSVRQSDSQVSQSGIVLRRCDPQSYRLVRRGMSAANLLPLMIERVKDVADRPCSLSGEYVFLTVAVVNCLVPNLN